MKQPIPEVTDSDVNRIVRRDFPPDQFDTVISILHAYGSEDWHREVDRVRLAVLKLAGGDRQGLTRHIETAKMDYRDVLAYAEYPDYMRMVPPSGDFSEKEKERIIQSDWEQYTSWLNQNGPEPSG